MPYVATKGTPGDYKGVREIVTQAGDSVLDETADAVRVLGVSADGTTGIPIAPVTALTSDGYGTPITITRPANQTPYTAGDVIGVTGAAGAVIDLGIMGPASGNIMLTSARLECQITALPTGMTFFTVVLFAVTPPSALSDNGAFTDAVADASKGIITLGVPALLVTGAAQLRTEVTAIGKQIALAAGAHLFAYLVTATGYTPAANSEVYVLTVKAMAL